MAAALAARKTGARTLLVEAGPFVGGDLVCGLPVDGCLSARGDWIVGGIAREIFNRCAALDGYIGEVFDWRLCWGVCLDPETVKLAIMEALAEYGVDLLLNTVAENIMLKDQLIQSVNVFNKNGHQQLCAAHYVDCTGDADIAAWAGAPVEMGGPCGEFQPVSIIFRMANVDFHLLLSFLREHPEEFLLAESPVITKSPAECALAVFESGLPYTALSARGALLSRAIAHGDMAPTTAVYMWPTSLQRKEIGLNVTRVSGINPMDTSALGQSAGVLARQVVQSVRFLTQQVPGFAAASLSAVAPRVGMRETRRIRGEEVLTAEDVLNGRKRDDCIAKGAHHIDVHGAGSDQQRYPVRDGGSYDIAYKCLVPRDVKNLLVAGRCLSSTREANGSARVMGQCLATGHAAGTAAALCSQNDWNDVRSLPLSTLRQTLQGQGAIV